MPESEIEAQGKVLVKCGHEQCFYECPRMLLKKHTEEKHPGAEIKESTKNSEDSITVNTEVYDFLELIGTSVPNEQVSSESIENEKQISLTEDLVPPEEVPNKSEPVDEMSVDGDNPDEIPSSSPEPPPAPTRSKNAESLALARLSRKLKDLRRNSDMHCRSLEAMKNGKDGLLVIAPEEDMVYCRACCKKNDTGSVGLFPYNFSAGVSFPTGESLPKDFSNLKYKINRHFRSDRHKRNIIRMQKQEEEITERTSENIAMRVLRTAYYVIKSSRPHKEFCDLIHLQTLNGMNMGDINHSASLIGKLRDALHDEVLNGIKSQLNSSELMNDLQLLADLTYARSAQSNHFIAKLMCEAIGRLKQRSIVPPYVNLTELCCQKVCYTLKEYKPQQNYVSNEELFKYAWGKSCDETLKAYMDIVVRVWLISPGDSIGESLTSVMKNVFGQHRHLEQGNALKELVIKWNGPPLNLADPLLDVIRTKLKLKFQRITRRGKTDQGTVLSHYRKNKERPHKIRTKSSNPKKPGQERRRRKKGVVQPEPMVPPPPMPLNCYQQDKINRVAIDAVNMSRQMCVPTMPVMPDQGMSLMQQSLPLNYAPNFFCN